MENSLIVINNNITQINKLTKLKERLKNRKTKLFYCSKCSAFKEIIITHFINKSSKWIIQNILTCFQGGSFEEVNYNQFLNIAKDKNILIQGAKWKQRKQRK